MKIVELEINIMAVPQGYYLAQGISRDLNFKVGLPAVFEKTYNLKEKLTDKYDEIECGETYLIDNVYSLYYNADHSIHIRRSFMPRV
jgi:hypothetical protein